MHAIQNHQILPDESADLITSSNEHGRDDRAVEPRGGSTPEAQVEKLLPCTTPSDGLYGRVHSEFTYPQQEGSLESDISQHDPLVRAFEAYERRYRHLREIECVNSAWRIELRHCLDNLQQHFNHFQASFKSYMETSPSPAGSKSSRKKPRAQRKKKQALAKSDLDAFDDQMHALDILTASLKDKDRKQAAAEASFHNAAETIATSLRRRGIVAKKEEAVEVSLAPTLASMSEHSSDFTPPVAMELEAYYSAVSMLRNMEERIGALQVEQQEQLERRGLMEDQGQVLDQNEEDFLRMWRDELDSAYNDFRAAQTAVKERREECDVMNIAIPIWTEVNSVDERVGSSHNDAPGEDVTSPTNSITADSRLQPPSVLPLMLDDPLLQAPSSPLATPPQKPMAKASIYRWIKNIDVDFDSQPHSLPQSVPLALSQTATSTMGHDGSDTVADSTRSDDARAST